VGHVAHTRLLIALTAAIGRLISAACCYCGTRATHVVSTSPNSSDRLSDISGPLLLPSTIATGYMTSDDCCYYWAHVMRVVATRLHSSDERCDNSDPSLLAPTVATGKRSVAIGLPVATGYLISTIRR
jgi:hypothetical protein